MHKQLPPGALAGAASGVAFWLAREPLSVLMSCLWAGRATPSALARYQRKRLAALVAFARSRSAYYRALYAQLPAGASDLRALPVVTKPDLMTHFDEWVTDPAVTRAGVEMFLSEPAPPGTDYLGRYAVWTTSGTTGKPGVFVHDRRAVLVYSTLVWLRTYRWVTPALLWPLLRRGRIVALVATGGHFAIADWFERKRRAVGARDRARVISALRPLAEIVRELNDYQPALLTGYPSVIKLLAAEQSAGRLRIAPVYVGTGGESLDVAARTQIEAAFDCIMRDNYGASEFPYAATECGHGYLHINADWLIIEPVDAAYQPVPPGQPSCTALLTNLANRVQPLIRYDLGDSVTMKAEPCPCGRPLPAMRVEGRKGDILRMATPSGRMVALLPLALGTVVEETPGVVRAQIIQTGPSELTLRLEIDPRAGAVEPDSVWRHVERRLREYLAAQGLASVTLARGAESPHADPVSGKYREVWSALPASEAPAPRLDIR
ncbi:MAG TPA: phenylacetate--CoA ligase family protein [Ktedonobacterales bacterium]